MVFLDLLRLQLLEQKGDFMSVSATSLHYMFLNQYVSHSCLRIHCTFCWSSSSYLFEYHPRIESHTTELQELGNGLATKPGIDGKPKV